MKRYNPSELEPAIQKQWLDSKLYEVTEDSTKPKSYVIAMFPYPSGAGLHIGHVRNYAINDTIARFERQRGKNVLATIGWDSFGLPAENYAIKTGTPPQETTKTNIANFKTQLQRIGVSFDWSRELNTTDPSYYKWTQWIFLQLYKKGLAYQGESLQWWCPECQTVLANEQVINGGYCWRHETTQVEKRWLKQWFFKITDYAEPLLAGIDDLEWPEKIKAMQKNWIGKSEGALVDFALQDSAEKVKVFTTRPDTIFGATFMVLAPEHPLVAEITTADQKAAVSEYQAETQKKSDVDRMNESREKTGVFTGAYAINPATKQPIPIWIADYVLVNYGTGAIMAVPAHDERDHAFAERFNLDITDVYTPLGESSFGGEGTMINSGDYNGLATAEMREKVVADFAKDGIAEAKVNYRMRDWLISRQRYWGAPIPIIHCEEHGAVAVPDDQLPVELPVISDFAPTGNGKSVLASVDEWVNVPCPTCGKPAKRETDTMDGYACSSWYYLRYTDANNQQQAWDPAKANYWMPIDYYCGGDHAVSHLLYSRFWMHVFADLGLIDHSRKEPVRRLIYNGYINAADGQKMSKSKGNVVDPLELINQGYGADSLRLYELFIAPYELDAAWDDRGIAGTYRFLNRVWTITQKFLETKPEASSAGEGELLSAAHAAIKKVSHDLENQGFNTAIAALMEYTNELYKLEATHGFVNQKTWSFALTTLAQLLAPFAPHMSEELWKDLGHEGSVHVGGWPIHDEAYLVQHVITIAVQVNGKLRGEIEVEHDATKEVIEAEAKAHENVAQYLGDGIKKTIYVPNKLVNFVV